VCDKKPGEGKGKELGVARVQSHAGDACVGAGIVDKSVFIVCKVPLRPLYHLQASHSVSQTKAFPDKTLSLSLSHALGSSAHLLPLSASSFSRTPRRLLPLARGGRRRSPKPGRPAHPQTLMC